MAKGIVQKTIHPVSSTDPASLKHRSFLHLAFLYIDLRRAIQWENGSHTVRHWKFRLPRFIGTGCKNYAAGSVNLSAHLLADFPSLVAYIATQNCTVNTSGYVKLIDQLLCVVSYCYFVYSIIICLHFKGHETDLTLQQSKHNGKTYTSVSMCAPFLLEAAKNVINYLLHHPLQHIIC